MKNTIVYWSEIFWRSLVISVLVMFLVSCDNNRNAPISKDGRKPVEARDNLQTQRPDQVGMDADEHKKLHVPERHLQTAPPNITAPPDLEPGLSVIDGGLTAMTPPTSLPTEGKQPHQELWYKPSYRERGLPPPRVKLLRLPPIPAVEAREINFGSRDKREIALTFDACSTLRRSRFDREIANILIRMNTPATLFVGGKWVLEHQREVKWLASSPLFEFANHTYLHGHLTKVSHKRLERELRWTQEIIYTFLGKIPTLYRPPAFDSNPRVVRFAANMGLYSILGDLPSGDPDPNFTKKILVRYVLKEAQNGSIVVMHINKGGHHTAEALPDIIRGLRKKGFTLVKVSTLLGLPAYHKYPHRHKRADDAKD